MLPLEERIQDLEEEKVRMKWEYDRLVKENIRLLDDLEATRGDLRHAYRRGTLPVMSPLPLLSGILIVGIIAVFIAWWRL